MTERKTGSQIANMTGLDLANWLADFDFGGLRANVVKLLDDVESLGLDVGVNGRAIERHDVELSDLRGDVDDLFNKLKARPDVGDLDEPGRARVAALNAARAALASRSLMGPSSAVDALDVVQVARFILTGQDPWDDDQAGEKPEEPEQVTQPTGRK